MSYLGTCSSCGKQTTVSPYVDPKAKWCTEAWCDDCVEKTLHHDKPIIQYGGSQPIYPINGDAWFNTSKEILEVKVFIDGEWK